MKSTDSLRDRILEFLDPFREVAHLEIDEHIWIAEDYEATEIDAKPHNPQACAFSILLDPTSYTFQLTAGYGFNFQSEIATFNETDLFDHLHAITQGHLQETVTYYNDKFLSAKGHIEIHDSQRHTETHFKKFQIAAANLLRQTKKVEHNYQPWK
jgi:hypothetical protein